MQYGYFIDIKDILKLDQAKYSNTCIKSSIESMSDINISVKDVINATELSKKLFQITDKHVFISHSHKNVKDAEKLATFLKLEFGLDSFIDSNIWFHSMDLLKKIDDEYSKIYEGCYDYHKRNYTTSCVNTLLTLALFTMIEKTPCFIFIDSKASLCLKKNDIGTTESPWILQELAFACSFLKKDMLKKAIPLSEQKHIQFDADMEPLKKLDFNTLNKWICIKDKDPMKNLSKLQTYILN